MPVIDPKEFALKKRRQHDKGHHVGITQAEYDKLFKQQRGLCITCHLPKVLFVEHHHGTNVVRGLACTRCNSGVGYIEIDDGYCHSGSWQLLLNRDTGIKYRRVPKDDKHHPRQRRKKTVTSEEFWILRNLLVAGLDPLPTDPEWRPW